MNTLRTTILLAALTGLLVAVGGFVGGLSGAIIFLIFAGIMNFVAVWFSDKLALKMAGAHEVTEQQEPQLYAMVREVANLAKMPMPRLYVIDNDSPNTFAIGRSPKKAVVAVTRGIRRIHTERELRAVIGNEIAHVKHRDILTRSIVATIAGAISMLAQVFMWSSIFGRRHNQNPIVTLIVILVAPIAAAMLQMGISRTREYQADKTGAEVTHDPEALADALEKLKRGVEYVPMEPTPAQESVSALYIVHPF